MEAYKLIAKLLQGFTRNTSTHNFYSTTDGEDCSWKKYNYFASRISLENNEKEKIVTENWFVWLV